MKEKVEKVSCKLHKYDFNFNTKYLKPKYCEFGGIKNDLKHKKSNHISIAEDEPKRRQIGPKQ